MSRVRTTTTTTKVQSCSSVCFPIFYNNNKNCLRWCAQWKTCSIVVDVCECFLSRPSRVVRRRWGRKQKVYKSVPTTTAHACDNGRGKKHNPEKKKMSRTDVTHSPLAREVRAQRMQKWKVHYSLAWWMTFLCMQKKIFLERNTPYVRFTCALKREWHGRRRRRRLLRAKKKDMSPETV